MRRLRRVQLDVVLGQDFEDGPQPQPPLLLGDAVPEGTRGQGQLGTSPGRIPGFVPPSRGGKGREGRDTHSKSVCWRSSAMGWNTRLRLRIPSRHAESAVLAKIRPGRGIGMFGNLLEASWECLGTFRDVRGEVGNVWGPPGGENPQEGRWRMFGTFQERATPAKSCVRALLGMFGNVGSL